MPRATRALFPLALVASGLAFGIDVARAQPSPIDLEWSAPPECPAGDVVRAAVLRDLGASRGAGAPLVARGRVEKSGEAWVAHLSVAAPNGAGERTLRASSCADLSDAAALIFALAIDPHAAPPPPSVASSAAPAAPLSATAAEGDAAKGSPASSSAPASSASAPPAAPPPPSTSPKRDPYAPPQGSLARDGLGVAATFVGDVGLLPSVDLGGSLEIFFTRHGLRLDVDGTWLAGTHAGAPTPGPGGDFTFLAAGARVGHIWRVGRFDLGPAGGAEIDRLHAEGYGVTSPSSDTGTWVTLRAGGTMAFWVVRGFALFSHIEATAPLSRPTFVLDGVGPVHRPAFFGGRAGLGAQIVFF